MTELKRWAASIALNRWARDFGYSDFNTFIAAGGSIADAADDIRKRIQRLHHALKALTQLMPTDDLSDIVYNTSSTQTPAAVLHEWQTDALAQTNTEDEPPDPENAQIQGAEHGEP
jgi:predicted RNA-binding Zn ribbon-like protein